MGKRIEDPAFLVQSGHRPAPPPTPAAKGKALGAAKKAVAKLAARQKPIPRKRKGPPRRKTAGHVVGGQKLVPLIDDRQYLDDLRSEPCTFTNQRAVEGDPVEAMHIGNPGKNLKNDAEAIPALHSIHDATHRDGITAVLPYLKLNPDLLLAILRAYARERYQLNRATQTAEAVNADTHHLTELMALGLVNEGTTTVER